MFAKNIRLGSAVVGALLASFSLSRDARAAQPATSDVKKAADAIHLCTQMSVPGPKGAAPLESKWEPGQVLRVRLLGGTDYVRAKVQEYARQWNDFSSVKFLFVESGPAEIRVSFSPGGSWSYVGVNCLNVPRENPTMNFGWLTDASDDAAFSRVVLHEFGHALGLIHEHQNPRAGIPWDQPKVYAYYWQTQGWSQAEVDHNLFRKYDQSTTQFSAFDPYSIMLYSIPAELTLNGYTIGWNRVLSDGDKAFISQIYSTEAADDLSEGDSAEAAADLRETGLEAGRPEVLAPPALVELKEAEAAPMAGAPEPAAAPSAVAAPSAAPETPLDQERRGKLESYIRNQPAVRKAQQLRSDPRIKLLPQQVRGDFLNEFGSLMFAKAIPSHDSLIEESHDLDQEQIEMVDRSFKFRDDVGAFRMGEAVLEAEILEHNKKAAAYGRDLQTWEKDVANHNIAFADYSKRLETHNGEAKVHNDEVRDYAGQCLGRELEPGPYATCYAWHLRLEARAGVLNANKAGLDAEHAQFVQSESALNARKAVLQKRSDDLNARKAFFDDRIVAQEKRRAELQTEEKKLYDWQRLLQPKWDFALGRINAWAALVEKFNARLEKALNEVAPPPPENNSALGK